MAVAGLRGGRDGHRPGVRRARAAGRHGRRSRTLACAELNEAFACQVLYCRDMLGIPGRALNVNGGAIAIGPSVRHVGCAHDRARPARRAPAGRFGMWW
ncbi:hypothetical protein ACU4GD_05610 [Cupriavidus basilensis]